MAINDITGDTIKSRANNKAFNDNFDRIFRGRDKPKAESDTPKPEKSIIKPEQ